MERQPWISTLATDRRYRITSLEPPSRAFHLLADVDPTNNLDALIEELKGELVGSAYLRSRAWDSNLLETAASNRLNVRILALLLDNYRRFKRRHYVSNLKCYDREALITACLNLPGTDQSEFLLANVKSNKHLNPGFPLLILLAATQSHDDQWTCHVLHNGKDVKKTVRSVVVVDLDSSPGRSDSRDILLDVVREAVHSDLRGILRELLGLNRPAVVTAASDWVDRWESVRLLVLARRRLACSPPIVTDKSAKVNPWGRVLSLVRRSKETPAETDAVAPHPILTLPGPLFSTILTFVSA